MYSDLKAFIFVIIGAVGISLIFINKVSDCKIIESLLEKNNVNNEKIDYIYNKIKEHSEGSA